MSDRNKKIATASGYNESSKTLSPRSEKEKMTDYIWELECKVDSLQQKLETNALRETATHQKLELDAENHKLIKSFCYRMLELVNIFMAKVCELATYISIKALKCQVAMHERLEDKYPLASEDKKLVKERKS